MLSLILAVTSCVAVIVNGQCPTRYARFSTTHSYCLPANGTCNLLRTGVDSNTKSEILRIHNQYRAKVALGRETQAGGLPTASNMMEMEWDNELAAIAQKWASNCNYKHDCGGCRAVEGFTVGQNLAKQWVTGCHDQQCFENAMKPDWESQIKSFYDEVRLFNRKLVDGYQKTGAFGHFTQLIWATSWKVGCGLSVYQDGDTTIRFYACNYGPAGNVPNQPVYKSGKPCTGCPENTCCGNCLSQDPSYIGLCQVINKNIGPLDKSPTADKLVDCNAKTGKPTCDFYLDGKNAWTIKPSLNGGYYYSITLNGGEHSSLILPDLLQPKKDGFCLIIEFRKGPADAANQDSMVVVADLSIGDWHSKMPLDISETSLFTPFQITPAWNSPTKVVLDVSVPDNAPEHIFDLRKIAAYDGTDCPK